MFHNDATGKHVQPSIAWSSANIRLADALVKGRERLAGSKAWFITRGNNPTLRQLKLSGFKLEGI